MTTDWFTKMLLQLDPQFSCRSTIYERFSYVFFHWVDDDTISSTRLHLLLSGSSVGSAIEPLIKPNLFFTANTLLMDMLQVK